LRYVAEFKTGEHIIPITFKLGLIAYQQANYDLSLKYLNSIVSQKLPADLQVQSEDMILDIYNIKKDYVTLLSQVKKIEEKTQNSKRRESLLLLKQQAHFAMISQPQKNDTAQAHIEKLMGFAGEYKQTPLAQTAHWQAIAQAYAAEEDFLGAQLSEKYYADYPSDTRITDALKEALKVYIDSAHISEAIRIVTVLSQTVKDEKRTYRTLECQLTDLFQQKNKALTCYAQLFNDSDAEQKKTVLPSYLALFEQNKTSSDYLKLQQQLMTMQIEPYATQILIGQAESLLAQGKAKEAFAMSLKINARNVDEGTRAAARVLQARILEDEFRAQSLKAREEKLSMVLAMKAEKLDKSLTAYTSALKMSNSESVQKAALEGIDRLYSHFITAVHDIVLPDTLSAEDKQQIQNELKTLITPFSEKHFANRKKMAELDTAGSTLPNELPWQSILASEDDKNKFKAPSAQVFDSYYFFPDNGSVKGATQLKGKECKDSQITWEAAALCASNSHWADAEKIVLKLAEDKKKRPLALYYLSLIAYDKLQPRLSQWLIDKSVSQNAGKNLQFSFSLYQQSRLSYTTNGLASYFKNIDKMLDVKKDIPELSMISGLKAFSERDYNHAKKEFSRLTEKQIYTYGMNQFLNFINQQTQLSSNVGG
jgi:cellulose synthase operon protein C